MYYTSGAKVSSPDPQVSVNPKSPVHFRIFKMPKFPFSLAERRPELFKSCQLPSATPVPVSYEGIFLGEVAIPLSGVIELPITENLIPRMQADRVMVMIDTTSLLPHDALDDFQMVRIVGIEIYDRN